MASNYQGSAASAAFTSNIPRPVDGEDCSAASVNVCFERLADRTMKLHERGPTLEPAYDIAYSAARTFTRINPGVGFLVETAVRTNFEPVYFDLFPADAAFAYVDVPSDFELFIPDILVPHGATIVSASARIDPQGADPGAGNRVKLSVVRIAGVGGTQTYELSLSEAPATSYTAVQTLTRTLGTPAVVDRSQYRYGLVVHGETGGSAVRVYDTRITWTATNLGQY